MNILITGVSRGLGFSLANFFIHKGNYIIGLSRKTNDNIKLLSSSYPKNFRHITCDLLNTNSIKKILYEDLLKDIELHSFVNNAAISYDDLITNANYEKLNNMFQINVLSPIMITKLVIRNMILHKNRGSIVHISSISAHTGYKGLSMYGSTKGAIESFSKSCSREWGTYGIRSNCIVAGFMETDMSSSLSLKQKNRIYNRMAKKEPVSIDSVVRTVNYLISNKHSKSVTGQNIFVDNGTL